MTQTFTEGSSLTSQSGINNSASMGTGVDPATSSSGATSDKDKSLKMKIKRTKQGGSCHPEGKLEIVPNKGGTHSSNSSGSSSSSSSRSREMSPITNRGASSNNTIRQTHSGSNSNDGSVKPAVNNPVNKSSGKTSSSSSSSNSKG